MKILDSAAIVAYVREKSGLTQSELAVRAGTSQPAVARYESGASNPSTATLQRLTRAAGFEVPIAQKNCVDIEGRFFYCWNALVHLTLEFSDRLHAGRTPSEVISIYWWISIPLEDLSQS